MCSARPPSSHLGPYRDRLLVGERPDELDRRWSEEPGLYAGGLQDAWDVEQLLAAGDRAALTAEVERALVELLSSCKETWQRIGGPTRSTR